MNINNSEKAYCQLAYMHDLDILANNDLSKPIERRKLLGFSYKKEFCIETYCDFETLKKRLKDIEDNIISNCKKSNINFLEYLGPFPQFIIQNKFQNGIYIGISHHGWNISYIISKYIINYFENKYGQENGKNKYFQLAKDSKELMFLLNTIQEPAYIPECDLVSEETSYIILKSFLDENIDEKNLDPEIFRQEVLKRNYL